MKATDDRNEENQWNELPRLAGDRVVALQFAQQASPGRQRFGDTEAEHSEISFGQNEDRDRNPELGEDDRT